MLNHGESGKSKLNPEDQAFVDEFKKQKTRLLLVSKKNEELLKT